MIGEQELVGLLYRADWTRLSLSGTVRGSVEIIDSATTWVSSPASPGESWYPGPPPWESAPDPEGTGAPHTLVIAPGKRFRVDNASGSGALGCDGERIWRWQRDQQARHFEWSLNGFAARPQPPFRLLLVPSWLLNGYTLVLDGEQTVGGRPGIRVRATARPVIKHSGASLGRPGNGLFAPPRWLRAQGWDSVEAVVDAELGILLRCSRRLGDEDALVTEFESVDVSGPAADSVFSAPPGSTFGSGEVLGPLGTAGREAAKAVAGLAAGGLGTLLKYAPRRRSDPFATATAEASDADQEAAMPTDEPYPGEAYPDKPGPDQPAAVSDAVLHLLYRSGIPGPRFAGTLHEWLDAGWLLHAVPEGARGAGFGGVGLLVDTLSERARESGARAGHKVSTVAMRGWSEYRLEVRHAAPGWPFGWASPKHPRNQGGPYLITADGVRQWQAYPGWVMTQAALPAPADLVDLVDQTWLFECDLSGGEEVSLGGRRAYRIVARARENADLWTRASVPAVALVDAESGLLLRLTRFKGGQPVLRTELRDIAEPDPDAWFGFTPPAGVRVVDEYRQPAG